jgi:hypothetical protein
MNHEEAIRELDQLNATLKTWKEDCELWRANAEDRSQKMKQAVQTLFEIGGLDFLDVAIELLDADTPQEIKDIFERYKAKITWTS